MARKIEDQILDALRAKRNFWGGNTEITVSDKGNMQVSLHGSPIVRIEKDAKDIFISLAKWNTNTTRARINLVLSHYGISRVANVKNAPFIAGVAIPTSGWVRVARDGFEIPAEVQA